MEATRPSDQGTGLEGPQVEGVEVQVAGQLGVGGEQDLEAPVQAVAVDLVGAHPAPDPVRCLEHHDGPTDPGQGAGRGQPGQPGPDDGRVHLLGEGALPHHHSRRRLTGKGFSGNL